MPETPRSPIMPNNSKLEPKKRQFLSDLNDLLSHYQYTMLPMLDITTAGVVPIVAFPDALPTTRSPTAKQVSKKKRKKK